MDSDLGVEKRAPSTNKALISVRCASVSLLVPHRKMKHSLYNLSELILLLPYGFGMDPHLGFVSGLFSPPCLSPGPSFWYQSRVNFLSPWILVISTLVEWLV